LFTTEWSAHGMPLKASFQIREGLFIILAVEEDFQHPSGCSIDDSTRAVRRIGQRIGQDLLRRDGVAFKLGDKVEAARLPQLKSLLDAGAWEENTLTFNTLVGSKKQLDAEWLVKAKETWLRRYLANKEFTPLN
jgi:hypothetical protein